jgi:hypothetical protein
MQTPWLARGPSFAGRERGWNDLKLFLIRVGRCFDAGGAGPLLYLHQKPKD